MKRDHGQSQDLTFKKVSCYWRKTLCVVWIFDLPLRLSTIFSRTLRHTSRWKCLEVKQKNQSRSELRPRWKPSSAAESVLPHFMYPKIFRQWCGTSAIVPIPHRSPFPWALISSWFKSVLVTKPTTGDSCLPFHSPPPLCFFVFFVCVCVWVKNFDNESLCGGLTIILVTDDNKINHTTCHRARRLDTCTQQNLVRWTAETFREQTSTK